MKFSIKDFLSTCDLIHRKRRIWSNLLKKSFMENFNYCAVVAVIVIALRTETYQKRDGLTHP